MIIFDRTTFGKAVPYTPAGMKSLVTFGEEGSTQAFDFIMTNFTAGSSENYTASKAFDNSIWVYTFGETLEDITVTGQIPLASCEGKKGDSVAELYKRNRVSQSDKALMLTVVGTGTSYKGFLVAFRMLGVDQQGLIDFQLSMKGTMV